MDRFAQYADSTGEAELAGRHDLTCSKASHSEQEGGKNEDS